MQNNLGKFSNFFSFLSERTFENFVAIAISTKENIRNNGIFRLSRRIIIFEQENLFAKFYTTFHKHTFRIFANMDFDTITIFFYT